LVDIKRSLSGNPGIISIYLDYGFSGYFELDGDTSDLPATYQAERDEYALEKFVENSVPLSGARHLTDSWIIYPTQAGCFSTFGLFGDKISGVRVDFEIENTSNSISSFYETSLLQAPSGLTSEPSFNSTLLGKSTLPGVIEKGFLLSEDLECHKGEYRIVLSNYWSVYLVEDFSFR